MALYFALLCKSLTHYRTAKIELFHQEVCKI